MEPTRSLPHLKIGMAILTTLTLSLCAFPVLMAEPTPSADSNPCKTDVNCELGSYCSASGKCIPCAQCSIYSRLPNGYRQCAKSFSECGPCIPGFTVKEESGGKSSRRCSPIKEVFSDFFATSTTSTIASVSENSSSSEWWYIVLGEILLGILVAFAACYVVLQLWRSYKPPVDSCAENNKVHQQLPPMCAPQIDVESTPPYESPPPYYESPPPYNFNE